MISKEPLLFEEERNVMIISIAHEYIIFILPEVLLGDWVFM